MTDTYQAVFDAVRSCISNGDIGSAVEQAFRDCNISHYFEMQMHSANSAHAAHEETAIAARAPHVLMRPALSIDGNQWCALYGANLQDGVAGFGDSPELAMQDFDRNWKEVLAAKEGEPQ